jgi:hypothetical protein
LPVPLQRGHVSSSPLPSLPLGSFSIPMRSSRCKGSKIPKVAGRGKCYLTSLDEAKNTQGSGWTRSPVPFDRGVSITPRVAAQQSRLLLHSRTKRLCKRQAVPA